MSSAVWQQTLGLDPNGHYTEKEYKKAYRRLATKHHPDKEGGDEEKFKEITEAYEYLTGKRNTPRQQQHHAGINLDDLFNNMRDNFEHAYRQRPKRRPPVNDKDIAVQFSLSLEDVKNSASFPFSVTKSIDCEDCKGVGGEKKETCNDCAGKGFVEHVQSQNGMNIGYRQPCGTCVTTGYKVVNPCSSCSGSGYTTFVEKMDIKIMKV